MTDVPGAPRASLALLRRITDRHVVDQLLATEAMTRAEVAAATGISKPTVSEAVRRLEREGVLVEAGAAPSGRRGPAGVHYRLRTDLGVALALEGGPDGLVAEVLDLRGTVLRRVERITPSPVRAAELAASLVDLVRDATTDLPGPVRAGALSLAGPVDRTTGRLVHLPHSPFLVDELDARPLLEPLVGVGLAIDNDVNWAALAEHDAGVATGVDDFAYLHLGHGLGGALVQGGALVRGHTGLAGEPAHVLTRGPDGRATSLVGCFGELGLLRSGSDTIAVDAVIRALTGEGSQDVRRRDVVVEAVAGVLATVATLLNPAALVVGGPWAAAPGFTDRLAARTEELLVAPTPLRVARLGGAAPLLGARVSALRDLRSALLDAEPAS
ncbi:Sugar kinase of the NBD/HSP70 family, may contain an N-terminal HTH domain [Microlunatus sagamiharensis]|uniref:Sugar kinase of the NBD/HSP70 family, may contain an N-terminal HTH domain n=1 Tax=Microlunatus sagamiharensis TaxID=546874 RepID=A0A1H2MIA1_9ACTN|nr:ROK family transcriptional regulator [Microlunatus sagamiharensis]SDU92641.1 Sugar kinase of the NBD/HSP70 family, may contain an N-terminal HTH domain [Microlunatus sagamiharensis]